MANDIRQNIRITATDNTTRGFRSVQNNLTTMERFLSRIQTTLLGFVGLNIATNLVRDLIHISDVAAELDAKMKLVTGSLEETAEAQEDLRQISLDSGSSLEANTVLFTRLALPVKALGFELAETTKLTQLMAQGLRISGASQQESASVIRQVSQAFQSGVLRGEEFNSLMENGGRIAIALADGLGVSVGALREMSKAGELNSRMVIAALNDQAAAIDAENARLPLTIGRSLENIGTQFLAFQQGNTDVNKSIADSINAVALNMESIFDVVFKLGIAGLAALTASTIKAAAVRANTFIGDKRRAAEQAIIDADKLSRQTAIASNEAAAAALKAKNDLAEIRANQSVLVSKQALLRSTIAATEAELVRSRATIAANQQAALAMGAEHQRIEAMKRVAVAQAAERAATASLSVAKKELTATSAALVKSSIAETAALSANTTAQALNTKATAASAAANVAQATGFAAFANKIGLATTATGGFTLGLGKVFSKGSVLPGLFSRIASFIPKLASGLLGLPGLILFVAGSFASNFVDVDLVLESVNLSIQKVMSTLFAIGTYLTNPFDLSPLTGLSDEYAALEANSSAAIDKIIEDRARAERGFKSADEEAASRRLANQRQLTQNYSDLDKKERELASLMQSNLESEVALRDQLNAQRNQELAGKIETINAEVQFSKIALQEKISDQADYNVQVGALEIEAKLKSDELIKASIAAQLADWESFYKGKIDTTTSGIADVIKLESALHVKTKELLLQQRDVITGSIDTLISERARYVQNAVSAEQRVLDIQSNSARVLADLMDDRIDGLTALEETQRAASEIQEEAAATVLEIGNAEKTRAKEFKDGSADELDALGNRNRAATLYKQIIDDSIESNKNFAEVQRAKAAEATDALEVQRQAFIDIQSEIAVVDEILAETRIVDVELDTKIANSQIEQLDADIKRLNQSIKISVERDDVQTRQTGGIIDGPIRRNMGGFANRTDGQIPGYGGGDKVKLLAEKGEFVVRKEAVNALGEEFMRDINRGIVPGEPIKRQFGGSVDIANSFITGEANKFARMKSRPSQSSGLLDATSIARAMNSYLYPVKYSPMIIERAEGLREIDERSARRGVSLLNEISRLAYTPTAKSVPIIEGNLVKFDALVSTAIAEKAAAEERAAAQATAQAAAQALADEQAAARAKQLESQEEPVLEDVSLETPSTLSSLGASVGDTLSNIGSTVSTAIGDTISTGAQALASSGGLSTSAIPASTNNSVPVETIDVNLNFNGESATGSFDNNSSTEGFLEELRKAGARLT